MYSKAHLAISAVLGTAIAVAVDATPARAAFIIAYAALLGTAIDADHFLIARIRAGDWRHLRFAIAHPRAALVEQDRLFDAGDVGALTRVLSHALIGGLVVVVLIPVDPFLALASAVVLYVHVVADLASSVRKYEQ